MEGLNIHWSQQIFLSLAIVSSLLLIIWLVYDLFAEEQEDTLTQKSRGVQLDARIVLTFFAVFGWTAVLTSSLSITLVASILCSLLTGFIVSILLKFLPVFFNNKTPKHAKNIMRSTGKVMQVIPPHQAGRGIVYLQTRRVPIEVNAITQGKELPVGAPIRVVGMIDAHTILVESLDESEYPHNSPEDNRPPTSPA